MKTKMIVLISILAALGIITWLQFSKKSSQKTMYTIGILQTASHPALDATRDGFMQQVTAAFGKNVSFLIKNAEGSIISAHTIAQHFHANTDIDLFFAIATPALQAMALEEKNRPILFSAVTDPTVLGIQEHTQNITGTTDRIDVKKEINSLKQLLPEVKTVGIIFNPSEINSSTLAQEMIEYLPSIGITPIKFGISSETEIFTALPAFLRKIDALLAPTDNMVASAISLIAQETKKAEKPFIVSDNLLVKQGALMAQGVDYEMLGKKAGEMAVEIINKKTTAKALPFAAPQNDTLFINSVVLQELGLTVPDNFDTIVGKYILV